MSNWLLYKQNWQGDVLEQILQKLWRQMLGIEGVENIKFFKVNVPFLPYLNYGSENVVYFQLVIIYTFQIFRHFLPPNHD